MKVMTEEAIELHRNLLRLCDWNCWIFDHAMNIASRNNDGDIDIVDLLTAIVVAKETYGRDQKLK